jgi:hypothetical protein
VHRAVSSLEKALHSQHCSLGVDGDGGDGSRRGRRHGGRNRNF